MPRDTEELPLARMPGDFPGEDAETPRTKEHMESDSASIVSNATPSPPDMQVSVLHARIKKLERDLNEERNLHEQAKGDLDDLRRSSKETAGELNRLLRRKQGIDQLFDGELIRMAKTLRVLIRDFTIKHFGADKAKGLPPIPIDTAERLNKYLRLSQHNLDAFIQAATSHTALIQSFLWSILVVKVFNKFCWAPNMAFNALLDMRRFLEPLSGDASDASQVMPEAKAMYHMWRANTSNLVIEAMDRVGEASYTDGRKFAAGLAQSIGKMLSPFTPSAPQAIQDKLLDIIDQSIGLDQDMSKQVANWSWVYPGDSTEGLLCAFEAEKMEAAPGQSPPTDNGALVLVLTPGLVKHGKSSGDDFDVIPLRLLRMQVFCDLSTRKSSKAGAFGTISAPLLNRARS